MKKIKIKQFGIPWTFPISTLLHSTCAMSQLLWYSMPLLTSIIKYKLRPYRMTIVYIFQYKQGPWLQSPVLRRARRLTSQRPPRFCVNLHSRLRSPPLWVNYAQYAHNFSGKTYKYVAILTPWGKQTSLHNYASKTTHYQSQCETSKKDIPTVA